MVNFQPLAPLPLPTIVFDVYKADKPANKEEWNRVQEANYSSHLPLKELNAAFLNRAHYFYGGNMVLSRQYFLAALHIQHGNKRVTEIAIEGKTLKELDEYLNVQKPFSLPHFTMLAFSGNPEEELLFAITCRWIAACSQNIDSMRSDQKIFDLLYKENLEFLKRVYNSAEKEETKKEANWQIIQIIYNGRGYLHFEKSAFETLKPFLVIEGDTLRRKVIEAQMLNILSMDSPNKATALEHMRNAFQIADTTDGFDPWLRNMFLNNLVSLKFQLQHFDMDLEPSINKALKYAEEQKFDHYYYSAYFLNAAKIVYEKGNKDLALKHIQTAKDIAHKFFESTDNLRRAIAKFETAIS